MFCIEAELCSKCFAVITWSDADFDDVSSSQNQLFYHLSCHHVSCLRKIKITIETFFLISLLTKEISTCKHYITLAAPDAVV